MELLITFDVKTEFLAGIKEFFRRGFELFMFLDEDLCIEEFEVSAFLSYLFVEELK